MELLTLIKGELNNNMVSDKLQSIINNNIQKGGNSKKTPLEYTNGGLKLSIIVSFISIIGVIIGMIFNKGKNIKKQVDTASGLLIGLCSLVLIQVILDSYIKGNNDMELKLSDYSNLDSELEKIITQYKQWVSSDDDDRLLSVSDLIRNNPMNKIKKQDSIEFSNNKTTLDINNDIDTLINTKIIKLTNINKDDIKRVITSNNKEINSNNKEDYIKKLLTVVDESLSNVNSNRKDNIQGKMDIQNLLNTNRNKLRNLNQNRGSNIANFIKNNPLYQQINEEKKKQINKYFENSDCKFECHLIKNLKTKLIPLIVTIFILIIVILSNNKISKASENKDDSEDIDLIKKLKLIYYFLIVFIVLIIILLIGSNINNLKGIDKKTLLTLIIILISTILGGSLFSEVLTIFSKDNNVESDTVDNNMKMIIFYLGIGFTILSVLYILLIKFKSPKSTIVFPIIFFVIFISYQIYKRYSVKITDFMNNIFSKKELEVVEEEPVDIEDKTDNLYVDEYDENYKKYIENDEKYSSECVDNYIKKTSILPIYGPVCKKEYVNNTFVTKLVDSLF